MCSNEVYNLYRGLRAAGLRPNPPEYQVTLGPIFEFMAHLCGESDAPYKKETSYSVSWLANQLHASVYALLRTPQYHTYMVRVAYFCYKASWCVISHLQSLIGSYKICCSIAWVLQ